jgi:hypothetical protein
MVFLIGVVVGLAAGFVVFRLYWTEEIAAGRAALAAAEKRFSGTSWGQKKP